MMVQEKPAAVSLPFSRKEEEGGGRKVVRVCPLALTLMTKHLACASSSFFLFLPINFALRVNLKIQYLCPKRHI